MRGTLYESIGKLHDTKAKGKPTETATGEYYIITCFCNISIFFKLSEVNLDYLELDLCDILQMLNSDYKYRVRINIQSIFFDYPIF